MFVMKCFYCDKELQQSNLMNVLECFCRYPTFCMIDNNQCIYMSGYLKKYKEFYWRYMTVTKSLMIFKTISKTISENTLIREYECLNTPDYDFLDKNIGNSVKILIL